jgi:hypothetical protein
MSRTKLKQHKQQGKQLLPPFARMEIALASWRDDRLPEMLWAAVLIGNLVREQALNAFRRVAAAVFDARDKGVSGDVQMSGIAKMSEIEREVVLSAILADDSSREILSSLLLFESLPGRELWEASIEQKPSIRSVDYLMNGVAKTLWHQPQEATDCRWLRLMGMVAAGKVHLPSTMIELGKQITNYPNEGEMSKVRPAIRAMEGAFQSLDQASNQDIWPKSFWRECLVKSPCFSLLNEAPTTPVGGTTTQLVREVYEDLIRHSLNTRSESGIDAKHDTTFGLAFYSLSILDELLRVGNSTGIVGRFGLRSLLEIYVTLSYLHHKNNPELWRSHRVFGAGQAKLSSLKLEEFKSEKCFADAATLTAIANEDMWEEYLSINIGHWENSNLRREAVESGVKAEYDKFYAWTSSFVHGHWGSVRESVFDTCGNPLHRLHRIPRLACKVLPDVVPDAYELVDKTLDLVSKLYPSFSRRVKIQS